MAWSRPRPDSTDTTIRSSALGSARRICFWRRAATVRTYSFGAKKPIATDARVAITLVLDSQAEFAITPTARSGTRMAMTNFAPYSSFRALGLRKPARIRRRCMMVVSFGDAGTRFPSFFSRSRNARLGWGTSCDCGSAADAVTRSMAALGQTQTFRPSSAKTPVSARKTRIVNRTSIILDLDRHDFFHDQVAEQLEADGDTRHLVARRVLHEELDIVPV